MTDENRREEAALTRADILARIEKFLVHHSRPEETFFIDPETGNVIVPDENVRIFAKALLQGPIADLHRQIDEEQAREARVEPAVEWQNPEVSPRDSPAELRAGASVWRMVALLLAAGTPSHAVMAMARRTRDDLDKLADEREAEACGARADKSLPAGRTKTFDYADFPKLEAAVNGHIRYLNFANSTDREKTLVTGNIRHAVARLIREGVLVPREEFDNPDARANERHRMADIADGRADTCRVEAERHWMEGQEHAQQRLREAADALAAFASYMRNLQ